MKAKFSSTPKIFTSVETKHFLAIILLVTIAIASTNLVFAKRKIESE